MSRGSGFLTRPGRIQMVAPLSITPQKSAPPTPKKGRWLDMSWFDKLLMKIALAKAAARGQAADEIVARRLAAAFREISAASADTSPSAGREGEK